MDKIKYFKNKVNYICKEWELEIPMFQITKNKNACAYCIYKKKKNYLYYNEEYLSGATKKDMEYTAWHEMSHIKLNQPKEWKKTNLYEKEFSAHMEAMTTLISKDKKWKQYFEWYLLSGMVILIQENKCFDAIIFSDVYEELFEK